MVELTPRIAEEIVIKYRTEHIGQHVADSHSINALTKGLEAVLLQYLPNPDSTSQGAAYFTYIPVGNVVNFEDVYFDDSRYYVGELGSCHGGSISSFPAKMLRHFLENKDVEFTKEQLGKIIGTRSPGNHLQTAMRMLRFYSSYFLIVSAGHGTGKYKLGRKGLNRPQQMDTMTLTQKRN